MAEILTKVVVTPEGEEVVPLTSEELTQRSQDIAQAQVRLAAEAVPLTPAEKLFAKTGLTVEEYKALGL